MKKIMFFNDFAQLFRIIDDNFNKLTVFNMFSNFNGLLLQSIVLTLMHEEE